MAVAASGAIGGVFRSTVSTLAGAANFSTFLATRNAISRMISAWITIAVAVDAGLRFTFIRSGTAIGCEVNSSGGSFTGKNTSRRFSHSEANTPSSCRSPPIPRWSDETLRCCGIGCSGAGLFGSSSGGVTRSLGIEYVFEVAVRAWRPLVTAVLPELFGCSPFPVRHSLATHSTSSRRSASSPQVFGFTARNKLRIYRLHGTQISYGPGMV